MTVPVPSVPVSRPSSSRVPTAGRTLPLEAADLRVDAKGGLARVVFSQRFRNPHAEPLSVTYRLPLPADGAVGGFVFRVGERTIRGVVEGRSEAREQYERAIVEGKSAALLEEDRSSLFTQEIGNIPPGETVQCEIEIDQPLAWLAEGSWEWRFPLAAAPRYLGAGPIEGNVDLDVAEGEIGARASLVLSVRDEIPAKRSPESPSHPLVCSRETGAFGVELGGGNRAALDRDVVVRWPVATLEPGASLDAARPAEVEGGASAFGLITLVPPSPDAEARAVSRDLGLLLDTSGSMEGEPLAQMKRVAGALVDSLGENDTLEMIEFSFQARAFLPSPERATPKLKKKALEWIRGLRASGGTEMVTGVRESLRALRSGSQRQIVMITDGLVGFERDVVRAILDGLPESARFHAVGVGSAVNRSLLAPVARAGRGIEAVVGLGEDAERASQRILSRTASPVLVDLAITGSALRGTAPARLPDCFAGAPARVALELDPKGGEIVVRGRLAGAAFERRLVVPALDVGAGSASLAKLFGRESVEDVETALTAGVGSDHDRRIEALGKRFSITSRLTSFVAVSEEVTVDPRGPSRRETQPQALPYGMSAEGLGLRSAMPAMAAAPMGGYVPAGMAPPPMQAPAPAMGRAPEIWGGGPSAPGAPMPRRTSYDPRSFDDEEQTRGGRRQRMAPPSAGGFGPPPPPAPAAPAPQAKAPKKGRGLLERAKDMVFGKAEAEEKPEDLESIAAPEPVQTIEGRIASIQGDTVVVEITVPDAGLDLSFEGASAFAMLGTGATTLAIDAPQSTREGRYGAGLIVRVVLRLATNERIASITLTLPGSHAVVVAVNQA